MKTLREVENQFDAKALDYLDREAAVPVVTQAACQGDVSFLRVDGRSASTPIPAKGFVVATGRGGHDHRLLGAGCFDRSPARDGSVEIGVLTVPQDGEAFALHDEHGALQFAPGSYVIGRQREQADVIREVED